MSGREPPPAPSPAPGPRPERSGASASEANAADPAGELAIAATLTGRLACLACGYDLRGLSVLGRCPECGLRIATSILAVVDPRAQEFEPIVRPRATAAGLLAWSLGAVLAALAAWGMRAVELPAVRGDPPLLGPQGAAALAWVGLAGVAISAVGALALVRPSRRQPAARTRRAALGVALYLPLLLAYAQIHLVLDLGQPSPYFERMADASRVLVRSVELVLLAGITLLLRPNARALAARCAILRTGRVDRQTLMAVAVSALLGILGDLLRLASAHAGDHLEVLAQVLGIAGVSIVVIASALLTIGLLGVAVDCVRIASALLRTGRRLGQFVSLVDLAHARQAQRPAP